MKWNVFIKDLFYQILLLFFLFVFFFTWALESGLFGKLLFKDPHSPGSRCKELNFCCHCCRNVLSFLFPAAKSTSGLWEYQWLPICSGFYPCIPCSYSAFLFKMFQLCSRDCTVLSLNFTCVGRNENWCVKPLHPGQCSLFSEKGGLLDGLEISKDV